MKQNVSESETVLSSKQKYFSDSSTQIKKKIFSDFDLDKKNIFRFPDPDKKNIFRFLDPKKKYF